MSRDHENRLRRLEGARPASGTIIHIAWTRSADEALDVAEKLGSAGAVPVFPMVWTGDGEMPRSRRTTVAGLSRDERGILRDAVRAELDRRAQVA